MNVPFFSSAMVRYTLAAVVALAVFASTAHAIIFVSLDDEFDVVELSATQRKQKDVQQFAKEFEEFTQRLLKNNQQQIEQLFGKPAEKPAKTYAMPLLQLRHFAISGIGPVRRHREFYPATDVAGVEVWYRNESPEIVIIYLKVDKDFAKLTQTNLKERLAWDRERFAKLVKQVNEQEAKK